MRPARVGLGQGRDGTGDGKADAGGGAAGQEGTTRGRHVSQLLFTTSGTLDSQLLRTDTDAPFT